MKRSAGVRLAAILFLLCCMIGCSGTLAETMQEEDVVMAYDFTVCTNVEITGIDLDSLTKEELAVLYQAARYCQAMTEADIETMREIVSIPPSPAASRTEKWTSRNTFPMWQTAV